MAAPSTPAATLDDLRAAVAKLNSTVDAFIAAVAEYTRDWVELERQWCRVELVAAVEGDAQATCYGQDVASTCEEIQGVFDFLNTDMLSETPTDDGDRDKLPEWVADYVMQLDEFDRYMDTIQMSHPHDVDLHCLSGMYVTSLAAAAAAAAAAAISNVLKLPFPDARGNK